MIAAILGNWKALAVSILIGFGAGWQVNQWRWEAEHAAEVERANDAWALKSTGYEIQLAEMEKATRERNRRYTHETRKDAYRCILPPHGLDLLNDVRKGQDG